MFDENLYENEDPSWKIRMRMLTKRKRNLQIAQTIDEAINEYYLLQGIPVPNWKTQKDPQWCIEYLEELGLDSKNP